MKNIIPLIIITLMLSCKQQNSDITNSADYNPYLGDITVRTSSKYFELWNGKIKPDSLQLLSFGHVAAEYGRYFKETGAIDFLIKAERALKKAVEIAHINKEAYLRALARNYISQHRFREALNLAKDAAELGGGLKETQSLLFDVHMELGNHDLAKDYLDRIADMSDFGYLIRVAKWNDYKGDLDTTINFMEKAIEKAESSNNSGLRIWSYTNIADYYGHAGRIRDAYEHYLKALALDPNNAYAKKGIAWIVFSHEQKPSEALRILDAVTKYYKTPDMFLLKAEIAEFMGDTQKQAQNLDIFVTAVANKQYGDMYNGHNVAYHLKHTNAESKAIRLAETEIGNRPTPESYHLLAMAYYETQQYQKALRIVEEHIMHKTYEPAILLNAAQIYKANHKPKIVKALKAELLDAGYELGPSSLAEINSL
ncbi:Hypothetical protein I595_16 [Croceitalea dokdonensis DOKDO 023]|uniref:Tetratricopeptide repeat protein n=1 Tax=Croceitalea dokdonensis DOKDO 023 TaxID=1300341 RepID=A0A0P7AWM2_9FLAO|nr:hypothetical protein [Croceitalea dokdonensis]KPM33114.1 Hypothetical protein I595_16 [Croceitalea dokdonensis DOKDO 023]